MSKLKGTPDKRQFNRGKAGLVKYHSTNVTKRLKLNGIDIAVILYNLWQGAKEYDIGFADANNTIHDVTRHYNTPVDVPIPVIESALWSAKMMSEKGIFWHPQNKTFNEWLSTKSWARNLDKRNCCFKEED